MAWKEVEFTGSDSAERLARLQRLCGDTGAAAVDGLIIIAGVDSFHSTISQAVLKYLLLGSSGQELLGEQVIPQHQDRLDDVILVISRRRVAVFYSSESDAALTILPKLSQWRNVTEFVVDDSMEPDEQEARKIEAFKEMVQGLKRVGIPYGLNSNGDDLRDAMIPEKWPLIQSYGLENGNQGGARGRGFFTMNHEVVNVSRLLRDEMAQLDSFSAKRIVNEAEPLLRHHFDQFLLKLDHAESPQQRDSKSEADMGEDLISLFEFGTTQFDTRGLRVESHRGGRVLFGKRTAAITMKASSSATLKDSGVAPGHPATHMLVQAEDPFSGVRFARTYFLSTGKLAKRVVDEDALVHSDTGTDAHKPSSDGSQRDTTLLIHLYAALVRGFRVCVPAVIEAMRSVDPSSLSRALTVAKAQAIQAIRAVAKLNDDFQLPERFLDDHVVVDVEILNACGQRTALQPTDWQLFYMTAEIKNTPSQLASGESLGSLVVGDSILVNRSRPDVGGVNVTDAFPYLQTWLQSGREAESAGALRKALQSEFMPRSSALQLGQPLLFSGGFCFHSPQVLPIVISFAKHVKSFCLLSTPYEELVLLRFELKTHTALTDCLPVPITSPSIALPLLAGTRFQEEILQALDTWKTTAAGLDIPLYRPHDLTMYAGETPRDGSALAAAELAPVMAATCDSLVPRDRSGSHTRSKLQAIERLFPRAFIPRDSAPTTTLPKPRADRSKLLVPITVTLGLPGSAVETMAARICDLSSTDYDWVHNVVDARGMTGAMSEEQVFAEIQRRMGSTLERIARDSNVDLPPRVMLTVVGYVDPITVAAALKSLPSPPATTKLSTIIACVSATNVCLADAQRPLPKLFDQLTPGFTTHVVVTHSNDVSASQLGRLRYRIDQTNAFTDIQVLPSDVFEGPITSLLAVERFDSVYYKAYREERFPQWGTAWRQYVAETATPTPIESLRFELAPGIERTRFLECVAQHLTPCARFPKALLSDKIYPMEMSRTPPPGKGIRLAQTLATDKLLAPRSVPPEVLAAAVEEFGECWCVEARLSFAGDGEEQRAFEFVSTGTCARLRALQRVPATLELQITGRHLNAAKINELMLKCYTNMDGAMRPLRNKVTLSLQEKREIQKQHMTEPLPEGFYYDGISYIDQFGGRHEFHPNIQQFIDEHLDAINATTQRHNDKVEANRLAQRSYVRLHV
ncbi:hypothetical protein ATCC90586_008920 [Pythium insidiosum]|nr:hypothetical protein ATCC90586_008920 [Pythium insidiosum]